MLPQKNKFEKQAVEPLVHYLALLFARLFCTAAEENSCWFKLFGVEKWSLQARRR